MTPRRVVLTWNVRGEEGGGVGGAFGCVTLWCAVHNQQQRTNTVLRSGINKLRTLDALYKTHGLKKYQNKNTLMTLFRDSSTQAWGFQMVQPVVCINHRGSVVSHISSSYPPIDSTARCFSSRFFKHQTRGDATCDLRPAAPFGSVHTHKKIGITIICTEKRVIFGS